MTYRRPTGRRNGLYDKPTDELAALMQTGWADSRQLDLAPSPQVPYAAVRRDALSARFPGERLVIPAGTLKIRSNDDLYAFRPSSAYTHLTGDQTPEAALVLNPVPEGGHEPVAYLLPRSSRDNGEFWLNAATGELWVGRRHALEEAEQLLGLPCRDIGDLVADLTRAAVPTRLHQGHDAALDQRLGTAADRDAELGEFLDELRLIKDPWEIEQLRFACAATTRGFEDAARGLTTAIATSERWIEGTFNRRARLEGNGVGYGTICAAGPHATIMHWVRNDGPVRPGELLLLDAGVETNDLYTADVTRTLPISGRFSPLQREIYDAVHEAQEAGMAAVGPGARYRDFHEASQRVLAAHLVNWGFLDGPADRVYELGLQRRYTMAGTGHMLGLDVHDCAQATTAQYVDGHLEAGMVLTVEPGLYFQPDDLTVPAEFRGIGVRIEDDLLVTDAGHENLSADLPRTADEVESWMAALTG
ncbi:aminopeptidase P family protein [Kribbella sp. CA-293567]|uniref:aminopeptidase P family protein n=1 Tax=Kribbella sp. CA-293567 TaxID=3002436 RepID=UPI0022DE1228|nr:aminopeptidase P family protein [Kribbella sp. CA-293567]WBQ07906.1 aminopeptidase P family protein [Kribbella sp. CA-293567]